MKGKRIPFATTADSLVIMSQTEINHAMKILFIVIVNFSKVKRRKEHLAEEAEEPIIPAEEVMVMEDVVEMEEIQLMILKRKRLLLRTMIHLRSFFNHQRQVKT